MNKKLKIGLGVVLIIGIFAIVLHFYNYNNRFYNKILLGSWGISIQEPFTADVLYESERGFTNDGERILKLKSEKFNYKVECTECYRTIELDGDKELLSEMIKSSKLNNLIKLEDLKIIDSVKRNKNDSGYFKYLIITFDENKKIYYIFERLI